MSTAGPLPPAIDAEWLEADGLGGYASGTVSGIRSRRYHALLLVATAPPGGRMALVSGMDAWVESGEKSEVRSKKKEVRSERVFLSRQRYAPDVVAPPDPAELESFTHEPWPTWIYRLPNGTRIFQELIVPAGRPAVALRWRVASGPRRGTLAVRPFL
jgi:glycogen debranching enzyme